MKPSPTGPLRGPTYRPWKRQFPTNELTLFLLYQQWTCLPWIAAGERWGVWLHKLHVKGNTKPSFAPLITSMPIEQRNGDTRIPSHCRPQPDPLRIQREARHLPPGAFPDIETIHPTIRVLKAVRVLFCFEHRWTKRTLAEDRYGDPREPSHPAATRWSLRGAIEREASRLLDRHLPSTIIRMIHHALVRTARKEFPADYRPAARAPSSAEWPDLIDRIHDARTFDHARLIAWCEATLDALRSIHPQRAPDRTQ